MATIDVRTRGALQTIDITIGEQPSQDVLLYTLSQDGTVLSLSAEDEDGLLTLQVFSYDGAVAFPTQTQEPVDGVRQWRVNLDKDQVVFVSLQQGNVLLPDYVTSVQQKYLLLNARSLRELARVAKYIDSDNRELLQLVEYYNAQAIFQYEVGNYGLCEQYLELLRDLVPCSC